MPMRRSMAGSEAARHRSSDSSRRPEPFKSRVPLRRFRCHCPSSDDLRHIAGFPEEEALDHLMRCTALWLTPAADGLRLPSARSFRVRGGRPRRVRSSTSARGKIVQAFAVAGTVVMRHEGGDLAFEIAGQVVVLEQGCGS